MAGRPASRSTASSRRPGFTTPSCASSASAVRALRVGPATDERSQIGPMINQQAVRKIESHIADALEHGAKLVVGGTRVREEHGTQLHRAGGPDRRRLRPCSWRARRPSVPSPLSFAFDERRRSCSRRQRHALRTGRLFLLARSLACLARRRAPRMRHRRHQRRSHLVRGGTVRRHQGIRAAGAKVPGTGMRRLPGHQVRLPGRALLTASTIEESVSMKIKAAVLAQWARRTPYASREPLRIEEVDLAPPGRGEVLIKIAAAGLCHSDLSVINGDRPRPMPMALGHEAAGVVEELGAGVTDLDRRRPRRGGVRARAAATARPAPKAARRCASRARRPTAPARCCRARAASAPPTASRSTTTWAARSFAEYATVSRRSLVKIDPDAAARRSGAVRLRRAHRRRRGRQHRAGAASAHRVAVIGLGGVGLAALLGAHGRRRARRSSPSTSRDDKLEQALVAGRDAHRQRRPSPMRRSRSGREPAAASSSRSSSPARSARSRLAYRITRRGGTTVTAGPAAADRRRCRCRPSTWWPRSARSRAATSAPACRRATSRATSTLYTQGRLPVDRLMTGRLKLDQINEGFDLLHEGKAIRQVVVFA